VEIFENFKHILQQFLLKSDSLGNDANCGSWRKDCYFLHTKYRLQEIVAKKSTKRLSQSYDMFDGNRLRTRSSQMGPVLIFLYKAVTGLQYIPARERNVPAESRKPPLDNIRPPEIYFRFPVHSLPDGSADWQITTENYFSAHYVSGYEFLQVSL
jgi:hypothetical protein